MAQSKGLSNVFKLRDIVNVKDPAYGAKGDGVTDDTAAFTAAMATGKTVFVPAGTYMCNVLTIPSGTVMVGEGKNSHLKFNRVTEESFLNIIDAQFIILEKLRLNGNPIARLTGGVNATAGHTVLVQNNAVAFVPMRNWVTIRDCWIDNNGFTSVLCNNAHNVFIENNYIPATTISAVLPDTGIAAIGGSSAVQMIGNFTDGFLFGISLSSDGVANFATVGPVRHCYVAGNVCRNTKTNGYGIEIDGTERSEITGNTVIMEGGLYGVRMLSSNQIAGVDVFDCVVAGNVVDFKSDTAASGIEIFGTGDITGTRIANNTVTSVSAKANPTGLYIGNGVKVRVDGHTSRNMKQGVTIDQNNVTSEVWLAGLVVRGAATNGINGAGAYANKTTLYLNQCDVQGSTGADFVLPSGFNVIANNTPIASYASVTPNTLREVSATGVNNTPIGSGGSAAPSSGAFTALALTQGSATGWQVDFTNGGALQVVLAAGGTSNLAVGSGLVIIHSQTTGDAAAFLIYGGVVTKLGGAASIVSGVGGANQIGLAFTGAVYQVNNGYAVGETVYICTVARTRTTN